MKHHKTCFSLLDEWSNCPCSESGNMCWQEARLENRSCVCLCWKYLHHLDLIYPSGPKIWKDRPPTASGTTHTNTFFAGAYFQRLMCMSCKTSADYVCHWLESWNHFSSFPRSLLVTNNGFHFFLAKKKKIDSRVSLAIWRKKWPTPNLKLGSFH